MAAVVVTATSCFWGVLSGSSGGPVDGGAGVGGWWRRGNSAGRLDFWRCPGFLHLECSSTKLAMAYEITYTNGDRQFEPILEGRLV